MHICMMRRTFAQSQNISGCKIFTVKRNLLVYNNTVCQAHLHHGIRLISPVRDPLGEGIVQWESALLSMLKALSLTKIQHHKKLISKIFKSENKRYLKSLISCLNEFRWMHHMLCCCQRCMTSNLSWEYAPEVHLKGH